MNLTYRDLRNKKFKEDSVVMKLVVILGGIDFMRAKERRLLI